VLFTNKEMNNNIARQTSPISILFVTKLSSLSCSFFVAHCPNNIQTNPQFPPTATTKSSSSNATSENQLYSFPIFNWVDIQLFKPAPLSCGFQRTSEKTPQKVCSTHQIAERALRIIPVVSEIPSLTAHRAERLHKVSTN
jgi:hypothetical protein